MDDRIKLSDHFTYGRLIKFVYPPILMFIFLSIYGVVDGLFVSNFVGKVPFAALNLIMPVLIIISGFGYMLCTGGSAVIAKTLGEGKSDLAQKYFSMLVIVTFVLGLIFTILGQIFLKDLAILLGAEGEMLTECIKYGRICLCSMPFYMLQAFFQELFVTAEKPKLGFYLTILAGCINMALDALFILGFGWDLRGAALATAISETVGGLIPVIYFLRPNDSLLRIRKTMMYWRVLGKACTNGLSEFIGSISSSVVAIIFNIQLLKLAGENGVAAYGVIMYVCMIFIGIYIGFTMGVSPIISFNFGAKNHDELKNVFLRCEKLMIATGTGMLIIGFFFARPLASIFVGYDPELLELSVYGLRIYSFSFLLAGVNIFGSALFTALNNGLISGTISFLRTLLFECGAVIILPIFFGLNGIWFSIIVAELSALIITVIFIITNRKRYHYL